MLGHLADNWPTWFGVVLSALGLLAAFVAMKRAGKAQTAAAAAETATQETRKAITRTLTTVELQRAIALVQRLKELHRERRWDLSLEHYQTLRVMLEDIDSRHPDPDPKLHATFREAIPRIKIMEDSVDKAVQTENNNPTGARNFNTLLISIQSDLENIASSSHMHVSEAEQ